jgi:hypothetical protein
VLAGVYRSDPVASEIWVPIGGAIVFQALTLFIQHADRFIGFKTEHWRAERQPLF